MPTHFQRTSGIVDEGKNDKSARSVKVEQRSLHRVNEHAQNLESDSAIFPFYRVYLIVGEASGDNIASKLMRALKMQNPQIEFYGIGGEKMQKEGMNLLFPAKELSVMGFLEVIPHIFKFLKLIKQTITDIIKIQPSVVITIDSPGFSFRIAKAIKNKFAGKLIHYVAPTVWAYKPERAKKIAKLYDHLLVILPFEPPYFLKEGLDTTFVGHPAIEDLVVYNKEEFRQKNNINNSDLLICLAPGSRKQEINTLLPVFLEAIAIFQKRTNKNIVIAIPAKEYLKDLIQTYIPNNFRVLLVNEDEKQSLFSSADIALTKSGTITTELAFYKIPMVVAHKVNNISYWLLKRMIKVRFATIINILADKELIPELLQEKCNPTEIANALYQNSLPINIENWQKEIQTQLDKLSSGNELPSNLAAKKILDFLK